MKKIRVLTVAIILFSLNSNAQLTKATWLVGGYGSFSSTNYKSDLGQKNTAYTINISPNMGYFIIERFATGLRIGFYRLAVKATGTSVYGKYDKYGFGPFLRYYFLPNEKRTNILVEGSYQYGIEGNAKNKSHTFSFAAGPVIYFNTVVGLEFLIGYAAAKYVGFAGSNGTIQAGIGLQVHLKKA